MMRWYVVCSKPRKEAWLFNQFTAHQITAYYPCYREPGNSHVHKPKPYFPGYLFVNVDIAATGISAIQWLPGSIGLVTFGGEPASVPDRVIQKIRQHVEQINNDTHKTLEELRPNDEIEIRSGPFAGYSGIFDTYLSDCERARIFLKFIQNQQVQVDLPVHQIALKKQL